jgi:TolA-binding protein
MIQHPMTQILAYTPYIPESVDIENNIKKDVMVSVNELDEKINQLDKRITTMNERITKMQEQFNTTIKFKSCDCIVGVVLFIVIYVKVYTS